MNSVPRPSETHGHAGPLLAAYFWSAWHLVCQEPLPRQAQFGQFEAEDRITACLVQSGGGATEYRLVCNVPYRVSGVNKASP